MAGDQWWACNCCEGESTSYSSYVPAIPFCACCGGETAEITIEDAADGAGATQGLGCCIGSQYEDLIGQIIPLSRCYCSCDPETGEMEMGWQGCDIFEMDYKCANQNNYTESVVAVGFVYCTYLPGATESGTYNNIKRIYWGIKLYRNFAEDVASTCPAHTTCDDYYDPDADCSGSHVTCTAGLDNTIAWPQQGDRGWVGGSSQEFTACDGVEGCEESYFEAEDTTAIVAGSIKRISLTIGAHSVC